MAEMSRSEALDFLAEGTRTGKLATASTTGRPHVAPVWFVVDGDELVFITGIESVKGRNLTANPRATVAADIEFFPYTFVVAAGPVTVRQQAPDLLEWSTRIAGRYVAAERADEYGRRNAVDTELLCRLRVERITGMRDIAL